ncbi:glycoside hydrolase family 38 C-terminal domain-containing protein [Sunxiuqinia sp. A32]|uniref:glycoside hydrolase family 38 N-terminal domain-containing protein n=1 Tax=Sunxiuqinia sp. A32 TaxID=3461496 RepID=UPI0040454619
MRKFRFITSFLLFFSSFLVINQGYCQEKIPEVQFKNAPVLFEINGKQYQQVIATYESDQVGEIVIKSQNDELVKAELKEGNNTFLIDLPAVKKNKNRNFQVKINQTAQKDYSFVITPPKEWNIFLVQHSHTDIGYTRPQSEILAEQMRYIDYALDYCDQTDNLPDDSKFRWTCESAWVTKEFLKSRSKDQIKRFKQRIAEGRIEVTGMFANMAEIADENVMYDFFQPLRDIKESDFPVQTVMQNDVNGVAWCIPDYLKNTGVKYLAMGINETRSIRPFDKPTCFWWESPSGERLLAFRPDHYMTGNFFGFETKAVKPERVLGYLADLEAKNYPFNKIAIQFSGYFTDNAPPSTAACEIVKEWNQKYIYPKLRLAVASEFFEYVEENHATSLPVYRNAWLDWWTDGYGSTSRETAEVRRTQNMKQTDEGMFAMVSMLGGELNPDLQAEINHISENAIFFDEHTCGADESISHPFSENSTRQWLQKGAYAWEALKQVTLLNEEALARLQSFMKKADFPVIYVVNSLGWERSGLVEVFIDKEQLPINREFSIIDLTTQKKTSAQLIRDRREGAYWALEVENIPALGYKTYRIELSDNEIADKTKDNAPLETLENQFYKIRVDKSSGAIISLYDKELDKELVDSENDWKLGQLVRETLPARNKMIPSHSAVSNVKIEKGSEGDVWESIRILSDLDGFTKGEENDPKGLDVEIRLYKNVKKVEFQYQAAKEIVTSPEALYVSFPFALPDSRIVFETIGGVLSQGQQLPGSSSDWNTAQNFVAVRGNDCQVIVVSDEIPLWQFSDFNMGKFERYPKPGKPWLYSWVMNNYWFTNFRAFQEGGFHWSYQLTSSKDTTNTFATKFSWGERNSFATRTFPAGKNEFDQTKFESLKITGSPNAMLVNSRPAFNGSNAVLLHFRELEGNQADVALDSNIDGRIIKRMVEVNILGDEIGEELQKIHLNPYEVKFIELEF